MKSIKAALDVIYQDLPHDYPVNWQTLPFTADNLVSSSATQIVIRDASDSGTTALIGTNFSFDTNGNPIGGTVAGLQVYGADGSLAFTVDHIGLSLADIVPIMTSADPLAGLLSGNDVLSIGGNDPNYSGSLHGYAGNDLLIGGAGNDALFGGDGNDTLLGKGGDDIFQAEAGNDVIDGGTEYSGDTLTFYGIQSAVTVDLAKGYAVSAETGRDALMSIENIIGGDGNDSITGNAAANVIFAGLGNDTVYGGDGNDIIQGNAGNDKLFGGKGDDTLWADGGNDMLTGGAGNDIFKFYGVEFDMQHVITDFHHGDKIDLTLMQIDPSYAIASIGDLLVNHAHQVGHDTVLDLPYNMTLTLQHVALEDLKTTDFLL